MRFRSSFVVDRQTYSQLMRNLSLLPKRVGIKHFRIALNAWGGVVRDHARANVRKDTRLLEKSLSVKVVIPDASYNVKHHGKPAYVLVGPGRRSGRMLRRTKAGSLKGYGAAQKSLVALRKGLAAGKTGTPIQRERVAVKATLQNFKTAKYRNPTRYAHLVEKKEAFIGPAQRYGATAGMNALFNKLRDGLAIEATALPK